MTDTQQPPLAERAVMICPQCEGEGYYADGLDEAACSTECSRCGTNGWIVNLAALRTPAPGSGEVGGPVAWIKPDWNNPENFDGMSPVTTYPRAGWTPLYTADMLERLAGPVQGVGGDQVEAVGLAVAREVEGPEFDPFSDPEAFDFACKIARAAIAAMPTAIEQRSGESG